MGKASGNRDNDRGPLVWVEMANGRSFRGWILSDIESDEDQVFVQRRLDDMVELVPKENVVGDRLSGEKNRSVLDRKLPHSDEDVGDMSGEEDGPGKGINSSRKLGVKRRLQVCGPPVACASHSEPHNNEVEILSSDDDEYSYQPSLPRSGELFRKEAGSESSRPRTAFPLVSRNETETLSSDDDVLRERYKAGDGEARQSRLEVVASGGPMLPRNGAYENKGTSLDTIEIQSSSSNDDDDHATTRQLSKQAALRYSEISDEEKETDNEKPPIKAQTNNLKRKPEMQVLLLDDANVPNTSGVALGATATVGYSQAIQETNRESVRRETADGRITETGGDRFHETETRKPNVGFTSTTAANTSTGNQPVRVQKATLETKTNNQEIISPRIRSGYQALASDSSVNMTQVMRMALRRTRSQNISMPALPSSKRELPRLEHDERHTLPSQRGAASDVDLEHLRTFKLQEQRNYLPSASTLEDTERGRRRSRVVARKTRASMARKRASRMGRRRAASSNYSRLQGKKIRFDPLLEKDGMRCRFHEKRDTLPLWLQPPRLRPLKHNEAQLSDANGAFQSSAAKQMNHRRIVARKYQRKTSKRKKHKFFEARWTSKDLSSIQSLYW